MRIGMRSGCVIFLYVSVVRHRRSQQLSMSDPLAVVKAHLGSVERWPSAVLMDDFGWA